MPYSKRHLELNAQFRLGVDTHLDESNIDIRFFSFQSLPQPGNLESSALNPTDDKITENSSFVYPVFMPRETKRADKAILMLHGLNERNWSKYLTWAEYLCKETGKPIILFPIAFHINRSPQSWWNPRDLKDVMDLRRQRNGADRSMSFANVTFSERVSEKPYRFYSSGRQSINDLSQLSTEIKQGSHPLFTEETQIDIFAYSIGAFLAEITMMTNPQGLFSHSKLFIFCGGGIFSSMFGQSRSIMDKTAFEKLYQYYLNEFAGDIKLESSRDKLFESFLSMIAPDRKQKERVSFFENLGNRFKGISLIRDKVMPFHGVEEALGANCAATHITKLDFEFAYTHENPFPVDKITESEIVDNSFTTVFSQVAKFLK